MCFANASFIVFSFLFCVVNVGDHRTREPKANGGSVALLGNSLSLFFRVVEGFGDSPIGRSGAAQVSLASSLLTMWMNRENWKTGRDAQGLGLENSS
jgi:hypothetical protein